MIRKTRLFPSAIRFLCLAALMFAAGGLSGCAARTGPDFPGVFAAAQTAGEALEALQPPQIVRLQDDMTVYSWVGREEVLVPAHYEFIRRRFPAWDGFYDYDYVWFSDAIRIEQCDARMIAAPDGGIVYRTWEGNDCERFLRAIPSWYDRESPDTRRAAPGSGTTSAATGG